MTKFIQKYWIILLLTYITVGFILSRCLPDFFPISKVGNFAEWTGAVGTAGALIYLIIQNKIKQTEKSKGALNYILSEVIQNQKRLNPEGIFLNTAHTIPLHADAVKSVNVIANDFNLELIKLIHAVFHDFQLYNATLGVETDFIKTLNEGGGSFISQDEKDRIIEWVNGSVNPLIECLESAITGDIEVMNSIAKNELLSRDNRHKNYMVEKNDYKE